MIHKLLEGFVCGRIAVRDFVKSVFKQSGEDIAYKRPYAKLITDFFILKAFVHGKNAVDDPIGNTVATFEDTLIAYVLLEIFDAVLTADIGMHHNGN